MTTTLRSIGFVMATASMLGVASQASAQAARRSPRAVAAAQEAARPAPAPEADGGVPAARIGGEEEPSVAGKGEAKSGEKARPRIETATFGAGCFWSTEAVFERVKGVKSVVSGFSGGNVPDPSYALVCTGTTGHAEVVQIEFDPAVISYETLLKVYFHAHDPTTPNAQGDDFGPQYRSVIFYHGEEQRKAALAMYRDLTSRRAFRSPIVTQLVPFRAFYPAEPYHQDYFRNHPYSEYTANYILPKLKKMGRLKLK